MPSQPCEKCGIDVDPDIQDTCPNCGREIKAVPAPVVWDTPPWEDPQPKWDQPDSQASDFPLPPPPPPPAETGQRRPGSGLSRFGVRIVLGLLLFGGFSAWNAFSSADRDDTGAIVDEGDVAATDLAVGDCLLDPGDEAFEEVKGVACSDPHDFEIFHIAAVTGYSYPTDLEFDEKAFERCLPAFDAYTGESYDISELWIGYFVPDSRSWAEGDRELQCYLYLPGQVLTASRAAG